MATRLIRAFTRASHKCLAITSMTMAPLARHEPPLDTNLSCMGGASCKVDAATDTATAADALEKTSHLLLQFLQASWCFAHASSARAATAPATKFKSNDWF